MSKQSQEVEVLLKECFPFFSYKKEYYVKFGNEKLFFDFYIPKLNIFIEVQGQQHYNYIEFFHKDPLTLVKQKKRDLLKEEWIYDNKYKLVKIKFNEKLNKKSFLAKINEALDG